MALPGSDPEFAVLDSTASVKIRREQALLRSMLARGRELADCALCGHQYPLRFLVAAHIKKRSVCTDDERRDLRHVAMLACTFGCDALYEAGWITVELDGRIRAIPPDTAPAGRLRDHLQQLPADNAKPTAKLQNPTSPGTAPCSVKTAKPGVFIGRHRGNDCYTDHSTRSRHLMIRPPPSPGTVRDQRGARRREWLIGTVVAVAAGIVAILCSTSSWASDDRPLSFPRHVPTRGRFFGLSGCFGIRRSAMSRAIFSLVRS